MGSLRVLNLLLILLVLVPAGVLGWLGFRAAAEWEWEAAHRIQRDLEYEQPGLLAWGAAEGRRLDADVADAVAHAAAHVRRTLPFDGPVVAMAGAEARLRASLPGGMVITESAPRPWRFHGLVDLVLVDGTGRPIHPPEHVPADAAVDLSSWQALLDELRRRADRLRFGTARDVSAALAVWQDARELFPSDPLRAVADVEAALLAVEAARLEATAAARQLEETWPLPVLFDVGRPSVRLWLAAADPIAQSRLASMEASGRLAATPLTAQERRRARELVAEAVPGLPPEDPRTWPAYDREPTFVVSADVAEGVRLVAVLSESWAWDAFAGRVRAAFPAHGSIRAEALRPENVHPGPLLSPPWAPKQGLSLSQWEFRGPGWGGREAGYVLVHLEADVFRREAQARRRWTYLGIAALLLLMVVGQVLVGRAVRRERAARRLRDDFIANVSHELRTPLTSVCFHAEMLADEDPPPERRRHLAGVVKAEGARLAGLVDDLLDFSALERGTRELEIGPVDLAAAVRAATDPYVVLAELELVAFEVEGIDAEIAVLADAGALARVLMNLLSNAWRHGRPSRSGGPGRIRVSVIAGESPRVEVRDDGGGVPRSERAAVFERFQRGSSSRRVEGAGLGLALGRELARAMGGDLAIVDDPEETVFRLTLPPLPDLDGA